MVRTLVHDRTVRVAEEDDACGVRISTPNGDRHGTEMAGSSDACEELLTDPSSSRAANTCGRLLLPEGDSQVRTAVEAVGFTSTETVLGRRAGAGAYLGGRRANTAAVGGRKPPAERRTQPEPEGVSEPWSATIVDIVSPSERPVNVDAP